MGLLKPQIEYFIKTCRDNNIRGTILTLGKMDVFVSFEDFKNLLVKYEIATIINGVISLNNKDDNNNFYNTVNSNIHIASSYGFISTQAITDTLLYTSLGFTDIDSIDNIPSKCSIVYDLNNDGITNKISKRYDLVLDGGVMEHVLDIRNVFLNMTDIIKENGYIMHILPSNNSLDHGFYQFSPVLFHDYYLANKYSLINIMLLELIKNKYSKSEHWCEVWDMYRLINYDPSFFGKNSFGQLSDSIYYTMMCSRKNTNSLRDVMPTQYGWNEEKVLYPWN